MYMKPPKFITIINDVNNIKNDDNKLKSVNIKDITSTISNDRPSDINVSVHISKYCSKNT